MSVVHIHPQKRLELLQHLYSKYDRFLHTVRIPYDMYSSQFWNLATSYAGTKNPGIMEEGHLETIQWLAEREILFLKNLSEYALSGKVQIVQWAMQQLNLSLETPSVRQDLMLSANSGKKDVFEWMLSQRYPINESTLQTSRAALGGHLELLQWLVEQRCELDRDIISQITEPFKRPVPSFAVFEWLYNKTRPNLRKAISPAFTHLIFKIHDDISDEYEKYTNPKQTLDEWQKNYQEIMKIVSFIISKEPNAFDGQTQKYNRRKLYKSQKRRLLNIIEKAKRRIESP